MSKKEYPAKLTNGYYRVREVWEDEASQLGAYRLLANAKAKCDENPGSRVFDNDGNVIYPEEAVPDTGADESEEKAVVDDIQAEKEAEDEVDKNEESAVDENEFPTAEELPATITYGKLKTLMNIRKKPSLDAEVVAVYKKNALVEVVQFCDGWLKIKCAEAEAGVAYVLNSADTYAFTASRIYTVVPGDNLWKIAEKELGNGSRCADIRVLNGLTSNAIRVGMKLLIP